MSFLDNAIKKKQGLKRGNDDVIDGEDRSFKVGKTRTILQPMVPTQDDPFGKGDDYHNYVIYLCCGEPSDSDFTAGLELCKQNCSDFVQQKCFQQDRTRHISLWDGKLTGSQAREIKFTEAPELPTVAFKQGWNDWDAGNYIEVQFACVRQLRKILTQLRPPLLKGKLSCNHLSLYRKRELSRTKDAAEQFQRVRKALASHDWGTLEGVSIRIKKVGTDYDQCKVLAGCLYL
jgi:hypothetical protein